MPYASHDEVETPSDGSPLWRYMDFTKFVAMLEGRDSFFAQLAVLGRDDPFEGSLSQPSISELEGVVRAGDVSPEDAEASMRRTLEVYGMARTLLYANCWHQNTVESAAMWRLYLQSGEGIAIRTTVGQLKASFNSAKQAVHIGLVRYIDYEKDFTPFHNIIGLGLLKRKSFAHEREVRALLFENEGPAGIKVPVDLAVLIESVYVSPTAPGWLKSLVSDVTVRYGITAPVRQSALSQGALY